MWEATAAISAVALLVLLGLWARSRGRLGPRRTRDAGPRAVPGWADFLEPEQLRAFMEVLELALAERELEAVQREGVVAVALPDGRPLQLGLRNLAQRCAHLEPGRWADVVGEHIDTLLGAEAEVDAIDRADFDAVRPLLKVRLYPSEALEQSQADAVILAHPCPGLAAVLVYDLPNTVSSVPQAEAGAWGRSPEELLAVGLKNLAADPAPDRQDVDVDVDVEVEVERGVVLRRLSGPSFFVASHLLLLERLLPQKLAYGALVCAPTRHLLLLHTIRDSRVLLAINAMIPEAHECYRRGPGSLTPNLYWWHDGQLTHLPTTVEPGKVKLTPPAVFVERVMEPMAEA